MFLMIKNKHIYLSLLILTFSLLQGCANRNQTNIALQRAFAQELLSNKEAFLNQPVSDVLAAFQRQPTSINPIDEKNNVVWLYDIYDVLTDPQNGKSISRPDQLLIFNSKIHWQERYYVNGDGIVYDIQIEGEKF